ncbi:RHS repeat-associated core domain-containing protein [Streptomyces sp. SA15]|uniref:RHS repeat-associated core domain-containing protein n=1 Tax=Streptomyces sp. SA15 TaxID=934019 RepID=UPI0015CC62F3|nr:RHS repeat-associated core domain-containing protein [Streptomyces sp. SA15]
MAPHHHTHDPGGSNAYTFDDDSNRTALATSTSDIGAACTSTGATSTASSYDSAARLVTSGTVYDAFGRTTTQASGATIGYYANDLVRQQTSADGMSRQTWALDAAGRLAARTTESNSGGTWTETGSKVDHYGNDSDSPLWTAEDGSGTITRYVQGIDGKLTAVSGATSGTAVEMTNIHGDVTVQLPLGGTAPTASAYDEYGTPEDSTVVARNSWLGGQQRSSDTATGAVLMGVRLYDSTSGRFLQTDPVPGGNANAYDYCAGDPVNCADLSGAVRVGSHSDSWWSPVWWVTLHLNKSETATVAWWSGSIFTVLWWAREWVKNIYVRAVWIAVEAYSMYVFLVAGYAVYKGKCIAVEFYGRKHMFSYRIKWAGPPVAWVERCRR